MGLWDTTKRVAKRGWRGAKRKSGTLARDALAGAAGVVAGTACAVPPITPLAPACAVGAALAVDAIAGERVERVVERSVDKAGTAANDYIDSLKRGEKGKARPAGLATRVEGVAVATTVRGDFEAKEEGSPIWVAAGAAGLTVTVLIVALLKRTGHI